MKKLSIGFHPYIQRKNPLTKKTQLIMRVITDGRKQEVRLDSIYDLTEKDVKIWNNITQRIDARDSDINDYLNSIIARRKLIDLEILTKDIHLSNNQLIDKLLGRVENQKIVTIYEYTKRYLREEIENSYKKIGTKKNYRNAIKQFCIFLELKNWTTLPFSEFKYDKATLFKKFLETPLEQLDLLGIEKERCIQLYKREQRQASRFETKKQNSVVSSSTKIKNIKPIFEKAIDEDIISKNPFDKIRLDFQGANEAPSLTITMLKRIYHLNGLEAGLIFTKDIFLFMCFTGFSYADTINFNHKEYELVDDNIQLLDTKRRKKTGCQIKQILCNEAQNIVLKYNNIGFNGATGNVFPNESSESLNRKLKIIQSICEIPFDLSTKSGRITFKNMIRESDIQNVFLTKKLMGWRRSKTIEDIYDRFTIKDFITAKSTFDNFLSIGLKNAEIN